MVGRFLFLLKIGGPRYLHGHVRLPRTEPDFTDENILHYNLIATEDSQDMGTACGMRIQRNTLGTLGCRGLTGLTP